VPEKYPDEYYIIDDIIVNDENLIKKVHDLRSLVRVYGMLSEEGVDSRILELLLEKIMRILLSTDNIQYTEFVAFWKVFDMTYSIFREYDYDKKRYYIRMLLNEYYNRRDKLYSKLGYADSTIQALYDSGVSRKKAEVTTNKIVKMIHEVSGKYKIIVGEINTKQQLEQGVSLGPCLFKVRRGGRGGLFEYFRKRYSIKYEFDRKQHKYPDIVLLVYDEIFIIEAKHVKEAGGSQDKQIRELISFIDQDEREGVHYVAFMDGTFFNKFINPRGVIAEFRNDIERILREKSNYFVNTYGFLCMLDDIFKSISSSSPLTYAGGRSHAFRR